MDTNTTKKQDGKSKTSENQLSREVNQNHTTCVNTQNINMTRIENELNAKDWFNISENEMIKLCNMLKDWLNHECTPWPMQGAVLLIWSMIEY